MTVRLLMAGLLAALVGCGKPSASPSPPAAPTVDTTPSVSTQAVTASQEVAAQPDEAQIAALLNDLTQAVRRYGVEQRRVPKALDELVAAGYLNRVPPAPAGKRFAINKNLQVYLANR